MLAPWGGNRNVMYPIFDHVANIWRQKHIQKHVVPVEAEIRSPTGTSLWEPLGLHVNSFWRPRDSNVGSFGSQLVHLGFPKSVPGVCQWRLKFGLPLARHFLITSLAFGYHLGSI